MRIMRQGFEKGPLVTWTGWGVLRQWNKTDVDECRNCEVTVRSGLLRSHQDAD